jgi:single-strand DNA-binding protein
MNNWNFTGNLGKDAEIKQTAGGSTLMTFSVAVKSGYGDNEKTNWVNCVVFGKRAEGQLVNYLKKGTQVAINGECELKEWQSQDGTQNKMLSVKVGELDLIGGRTDDAVQQKQAQQQAPHNQPRGGHMAPPQQPGYNGGQPIQQPSGFGQQQPSGQPAPAPNDFEIPF